MHQLIAYFDAYLPLNAAEKALLEPRVQPRTIKRRELLMQAGSVCKHYSFVTKGCFKMYGIDDNGTKHNIQFAAENDWIMDIGSFHAQKPGQLYIEAIEPSEVLQIERENLYFLYLNIPKLDRIFKVIIENKYIELQNRVLQNFSSTALQRYLHFLEQYPHLANRLPNAQIASYLGITPEFLSKIRKERMAKT
jgi:CRP-like cAMP-binding protein